MKPLRTPVALFCLLVSGNSSCCLGLMAAAHGRALILHSRALQKYSAYATWLDVYVTLTAPPVSALTGVLGSTFKPSASSAASGSTTLAGSLSSRVQ